MIVFFFSQGLANVNTQLTVANEEVIMHLREKGEVSNAVLIMMNRLY
jgi:hypothetical protein